MRIAISEIITRSEQGVTKPFICLSDDGRKWFVKGLAGVGAEALRAEWICGRLAKILHLPIPDFAIAEVDETLVASSAVKDVFELGRKYAFASKAVEGAQEISFTQAMTLPMELRARMLLFDWWVRNEDRTLGAISGNPNIISTGCSPITAHIIDHHNAFDVTFSEENFWKTHIFSDAKVLWTLAWIRRESKRLLTAAKELSDAWDLMPEAWNPEGDSTSSTSALEQTKIAGILSRPKDAPADFWKHP